MCLIKPALIHCLYKVRPLLWFPVSTLHFSFDVCLWLFYQFGYFDLHLNLGTNMARLTHAGFKTWRPLGVKLTNRNLYKYKSIYRKSEFLIYEKMATEESTRLVTQGSIHFTGSFLAVAQTISLIWRYVTVQIDRIALEVLQCYWGTNSDSFFPLFSKPRGNPYMSLVITK